MNAYHTYFLAVCVQVVDSFAGSFGYGTHCYDYAVGVFCTVVGEQFVFAAGNFREFVHVFFYDGRNGVVVWVAALAVCKESFGVLGHAACNGVLGRECACTELGECLLVDERTHVFIVDDFDFLVFVRCTETVEEIDERYAAFNCCKVSNGGKIHNFLYAAFAKHCESCLAAGHHVAVVAENAKGV